MKELEEKIEQIRDKMYQAYNERQDEETILKISTQLDRLLNEQRILTTKVNK